MGAIVGIRSLYEALVVKLYRRGWRHLTSFKYLYADLYVADSYKVRTDRRSASLYTGDIQIVSGASYIIFWCVAANLAQALVAIVIHDVELGVTLLSSKRL